MLFSEVEFFWAEESRGSGNIVKGMEIELIFISSKNGRQLRTEAYGGIQKVHSIKISNF